MTSHPIRFNIVRLSFIALGIIFVGRLAYLQIINHAFYDERSKKQIEKIVKIYPSRGHIYDVNHHPLALTQTAYSAYIHPQNITNPTIYLSTVRKKLLMPHDTMEKKITSKRHFVWLKRKIDEALANELKAENIDGLHFIKEEKRVYPNRHLSSTLIGFVGIDNQGLGGLEYKFNDDLKGSAGKIIFDADPRRQRLISGRMETLARPYDGNHILTTIDTNIQYMAEKYLIAEVQKQRAKKGQVIVINPKNGHIIALANTPNFNPNHWQLSQAEHRKNSSISDIFEPGSIFKIVTVAAIIEEELVTPDTIISVPETITIYDKTIKEAHARDDPEESDEKTVSEIMEKSLNVGTSILADRLGPQKFYRYIKSFGFGSKTGIELSGESSGLFRHVNDWSGIDHATISFGQGIACTPLQMATAVSAVANGGLLIKPTLIHMIIDKNEETLKGSPKTIKRRVISQKTAVDVTNMLVNTVENGTGQIAKISGYKIAGKTGTAQKAREDGRGYEKGKYVSSFIGYFPADDPEYLILVAIDSPEKFFYGSQVAGPVFRNIANDIIQYKNIPPDT